MPRIKQHSVVCECGARFSVPPNDCCPSCFAPVDKPAEKIDYSGVPMPKETPKKVEFSHPEAETPPKPKPVEPKKVAVHPKPPEQKPVSHHRVTPHECDPKIKQQGIVVAIIKGVPQSALTRICLRITNEFAEPTDWHFQEEGTGSLHSVIKTLGRPEVVRSLLPTISYHCECGMPMSTTHRCKVCTNDN